MHLRDKNTLKGIISGVVTDLLTHSYPTVKAINIAGEIPLYSMENIAAMKVNAVSGDGSRIKDIHLYGSFSLPRQPQYHGEKDDHAGYKPGPQVGHT